MPEVVDYYYLHKMALDWVVRRQEGKRVHTARRRVGSRSPSPVPAASSPRPRVDSGVGPESPRGLEYVPGKGESPPRSPLLDVVGTS